MYQQRLGQTNCYIRCAYDPYSSLNLRNRGDIKRVIIQLLGAGTFKNALDKNKIPYNTSFSGVYPFSNSQKYEKIFPQFLTQIKDGGIIMCHPGYNTQLDFDPIAMSRFDEFHYLNSAQFLLDCKEHNVAVNRFKKNQ